MVVDAQGRGTTVIRRKVVPLGEPIGRLVTAVITDALLPGLGVDRVVYAVRSPAGRLALAPLGDQAVGCTGGPISLAELATAVGRMRTVEPGGRVRFDDSTEPPVITYAMDAGSLGWLVAAGLCTRKPDGAELEQLHASLCSGLRSLVQESLGVGFSSLPQVSIRLSGDGYVASGRGFAGAGDDLVEGRGSTAVDAVARAAASASHRDVVIRFAAQKAVGSAVVTLVVADVDGVGPLVGATGLDRPSIAAPALAVKRACDSADRFTAESSTGVSVEAPWLRDGQFALG